MGPRIAKGSENRWSGEGNTPDYHRSNPIPLQLRSLEYYPN